MAVNLSVAECATTKVKMETDISSDELILIKGGRPAFFAIKRMDPELVSSAPKSPENHQENIYQHCKTVCARLLRLLDSVTPELVTYSYMSHWADRQQCQLRLEILNRAKDKVRSTIVHADEMFQVIEEVVNSLLGKLPILVVDKISGCMNDLLNEDFKKFQALKSSSEIVEKVFSYLCECCFVAIPASELSAQDESPKKYCDCHNFATFCTSCNRPNTPCSLCANVKLIFKTLRALGKCEFNVVGSYNQATFNKALGGKTIEDQLEYATTDSGCDCSDLSDNDDDDDAEEEGDQENAEDEGDGD